MKNALSKKVENLRTVLDLRFCHHKFVRMHRTIRCTLAMEAGVTSTPPTAELGPLRPPEQKVPGAGYPRKPLTGYV